VRGGGQVITVITTPSGQLYEEKNVTVSQELNTPGTSTEPMTSYHEITTIFFVLVASSFVSTQRQGVASIYRDSKKGLVIK
jgi:hypothetical protein